MDAESPTATAGLVHGEGYSYRVGDTPKVPGIELEAEDYRRLARLAKTDAVPTVELTSAVRYYDDDHNAYNIIAEIPGRDPKAGYVMAGAHLDSWVAADGANDNGAGSVVVMEIARMLTKLGVKPKRTIRFVLWSGEEQGLLGSMAYVEQHLAKRPPVTDPELAKLSPFNTWNTRWPITPLPGHAELAAYFNFDNGSGKVRGIYTEGNNAVVPIFREWLGPFGSMGASRVVASAHRGNRPRADAIRRHSGVPVHPGPARLQQPRPPYERGYVRPHEDRRPQAGDDRDGVVLVAGGRAHGAAAANAARDEAGRNESVRVRGRRRLNELARPGLRSATRGFELPVYCADAVR